MDRKHLLRRLSGRADSRRRQEGYVLLVILLMLSLLTITFAKALPAWSAQIRREREARAIDHARGYRTAIGRYFHQYGRYPPSLDVLLKQDGHGLRYLREAWNDPLAENDAVPPPKSAGMQRPVQTFHGWQVLHYGQAVTAEIVDQPPAAALGKKAGRGIAGPDLTAGTGSDAATSSGPLLTPGRAVESLPMASVPPGMAASGLAGTAMGGAGDLGLNGMGSGQTGSGLAGGGAGTGMTGTGPGSGIGGGPVIGVAPLSEKPAVHAFNGFDRPSHWQFVYNFATDPSLRSTVNAPLTSQQGLTPSTGAQQPPASAPPPPR